MSAERQRRKWRKRRRGSPEPVDVRLTVRFKLGETEEDTLTMIDDRRVPMVGSLLENRDRILRGFSALLYKAALLQPWIARELAPFVGALNRSRRPSK